MGDHAATVVRSELSARTWIIHIAFAEMATTQAGPLNAVKAYTEAECLRFVTEPAGLVWRCIERDADGWVVQDPFSPTPDTAEWVDWLLTDESWAEWREANPDQVAALQGANS